MLKIHYIKKHGEKGRGNKKQNLKIYQYPQNLFVVVKFLENIALLI